METIVINILSNSARRLKIGGPGKVFINTCKGFDRIGQKYVINQNPDNYDYNWIHDSVKDLINISVRRIPAVVGPNIVVLPTELPWLLTIPSRFTYLHPSEWCVNVWKDLNFNSCKLNIWPVGIDWEEFSCIRGVDAKNKVMLYVKNQPSELVDKVVSLIKDFNLEINLVKYGSYSEEEFKDVLKHSSFGIWIGTTESQGIALLEALGSDLPIIVLNNTKLNQSYGKNLYRFPRRLESITATSVPYFDTNCGIIIDHIEDLRSAISTMIINFDHFHPQEFIRNTLSLEKCARQLQEYIKALHISKNQSKKSRFIPFLNFHGHLIYILYLMRRKFKALRNILLYS